MGIQRGSPTTGRTRLPRFYRLPGSQRHVRGVIQPISINNNSLQSATSSLFAGSSSLRESIIGHAQYGLSIVYYYHMLFLPKGKVRPADKLQLRAAKILPLVGLARSKQNANNCGHSAQYYTAPRQPEDISMKCIKCHSLPQFHLQCHVPQQHVGMTGQLLLICNVQGLNN